MARDNPNGDDVRDTASGDDLTPDDVRRGMKSPLDREDQIRLANDWLRLHAEIERQGVLLDLIDSRTGWTMLGRIEKRLNALTSALNRASKLTKARRWLRRKLHPDAEPLYAEAMTNMAGAVAEVAVHAVVEGRFAANVHESNERLREGIRAIAEELEADIPHDAGNAHCHHIARILRALLDDETATTASTG